MGMRQRADTRKVAEFTYSTFSTPIIAMSTPPIAGPSNNPMLFVPWIKAFAVTNSVGRTKRGTADTKAGPKMVETIDVKKIKTYRPSRERRSRANKAGMRKVMTVRIKSTQTITIAVVFHVFVPGRMFAHCIAQLYLTQ